MTPLLLAAIAFGALLLLGVVLLEHLAGPDPDLRGPWDPHR